MKEHAEKFTDTERLYMKAGAELLIFDTINFLIVFTAGRLMKKSIESILFLTAFTAIRIHAGGYHADTHLKCCAGYCLVSITAVFLSGIGSPVFRYLLFAASLPSFAYILKKAPAVHPKNPLTEEEYSGNRRKAQCLALILEIASAVLLLMHSRFMIITALTMILTALLMMPLERKRER